MTPTERDDVEVTFYLHDALRSIRLGGKGRHDLAIIRPEGVYRLELHDLSGRVQHDSRWGGRQAWVLKSPASRVVGGGRIFIEKHGAEVLTAGLRKEWFGNQLFSDVLTEFAAAHGSIRSSTQPSPSAENAFKRAGAVFVEDPREASYTLGGYWLLRKR